jgi:multiple sugar transport system permease protein
VLPFLATPVAMGVVWTWFFAPTTGIVTEPLGHVGIVGPAWLSNAATAMPIVAFANVGQYAGYNMLSFLAGLRAVSLTLYEAARSTGPARFRRSAGSRCRCSGLPCCSSWSPA